MWQGSAVGEFHRSRGLGRMAAGLLAPVLAFDHVRVRAGGMERRRVSRPVRSGIERLLHPDQRDVRERPAGTGRDARREFLPFDRNTYVLMASRQPLNRPAFEAITLEEDR